MGIFLLSLSAKVFAQEQETDVTSQYEISLLPLPIEKYIKKDFYYCHTDLSFLLQELTCPHEVLNVLPPDHRMRPGHLFIQFDEINDNTVLYFFDHARAGDDDDFTHGMRLALQYLDYHGIQYGAEMETRLYTIPIAAVATYTDDPGAFEVRDGYYDAHNQLIFGRYMLTENFKRLNLHNMARNKLFTWSFALVDHQLIPMKKTFAQETQTVWHNTLYPYHFENLPAGKTVLTDPHNEKRIIHFYNFNDELHKKKQHQVDTEIKVGLQKNIRLFQNKKKQLRLRFATQVGATGKFGFTSQFALSNDAEVSLIGKWFTVYFKNQIAYLCPAAHPDPLAIFPEDPKGTPWSGQYQAGVRMGRRVGFALDFAQSYFPTYAGLYQHLTSELDRDTIGTISLYLRFRVKKKN